MNERTWLTCTDPGVLIDELNQRAAASPRKFRLFCCACARLVWHLMPALARNAIEIAEQFADGLVTDAEREAAQEAAFHSIYHDSLPTPYRLATLVAARAVWKDRRQNHGNAEGALYVVSEVLDTLQAETAAGGDDTAISDAINQLECQLYRDVMGNPFRPTTVAPGWHIWQDSSTMRIAEAIYAERAFEQLPFLADALTGAGCSDRAILNHCRTAGPHVRGCWVVDLLLDKR